MTTNEIKKAFADLLDNFGELLSNNGCNDFTVDNTPEMYNAIERANAADYNLTLEQWLISPDYFPPSLSKDKTKIYTSDYVILAMMKKELGL